MEVNIREISNAVMIDSLETILQQEIRKLEIDKSGLLPIKSKVLKVVLLYKPIIIVFIIDEIFECNNFVLQNICGIIQCNSTIANLSSSKSVACLNKYWVNRFTKIQLVYVKQI